MAKKHVWRVKKEYFRQLKNGSKSLEIRVGYSQIKKVKRGDTITFENYGPNEFDVLCVSVYDSFERMLEVEGADSVLPGMTFDVVTALVENCFEWLGTTKPLITIADYKLDQFTGLIKKYGWEETQVLDTSYYNDHSREHVFNGTIQSTKRRPTRSVFFY